MKNEVIATYFFTGMEAVLGEAASNCTGDTKLEEIDYKDGDYSDDVMERTHFCVKVLSDGSVSTGVYTVPEGEQMTQSDARQKAQKVALVGLNL